MLSTALIVGFVGASFFAALTLFAACIAVGRVAPANDKITNRSRAALSANSSVIVDVEWRRLDEQPVA